MREVVGRAGGVRVIPVRVARVRVCSALRGGVTVAGVRSALGGGVRVVCIRFTRRVIVGILTSE